MIITETLAFGQFDLPADTEMIDGRVVRFAMDASALGEKLEAYIDGGIEFINELLRLGTPLKVILANVGNSEDRADPLRVLIARGICAEDLLDESQLGFQPDERKPLERVERLEGYIADIRSIARMLAERIVQDSEEPTEALKAVAGSSTTQEPQETH